MTEVTWNAVMQLTQVTRYFQKLGIRLHLAETSIYMLQLPSVLITL